MRPYKLYIACLLFISGFSAFGQNAENSQKLFDRAEQYYDSLEFTQARTKYQEAARSELGATNPDSAFIAISYYGMALSSMKQNTAKSVQEAQNSFRKAFKLATRIGETMVAQTIAEDWASLYSLIVTHDVRLSSIKDSSFTGKSFFPVVEVLEKKQEFVRVKVGAGYNQGVFVGAKGGVLTAYTGKQDRGNKVIGTCEVVEVLNNSCIIQFTPNQDGKNMGIEIKPLDNVQLRRYETKNVYKGILYRLQELNIFFKREGRSPMYHRHMIQELENYFEEDILVGAMLKKVNGTADYFLAQNDSSEVFNKPLNLPRFGTVSLLQGMSKSKLLDMRAFLRFVIEYPARYMGVFERIDDKYGQWLLNDMLVPAAEQEYLLEEIRNQKDFNQWLELAQVYLKSDTSFYETGTTAIAAAYNSGDYESARHLGLRFMAIAKKLNNPKYQAKMGYELGMVYYNKLEHQTAVYYFDTAIMFDTAYGDAYWQRGNLYLVLDNSKKAIANFEKVIQFYPYFASAHGNIGWEYFKVGKFKKAAKYIIEAHHLDSTEPAWSINRGHLDVVQGDGNKALYYYKQGLSNISDPEHFKGSILADFDLFKENGWSEESFDELRKQIEHEYQEHYAFKILSKMYVNKGDKALDNDDTEKALENFRLALKMEKEGRSVNYVHLRTIYRWIGFTHYKAKEYRKSIDYYKLAWRVAKKRLQNLDNELSDLTAVDNVYSYIDRDQERRMYQEFKNAVQRKINQSRRSRTLYLISVGKADPNTDGMKYAANDALNIHDRITANADLLFDSLVQYNMVGADIKTSHFGEAMLNVMMNSEPKDVFLFYYAGNMKGDSMILGENAFLEMGEFARGLLQCQAGEQLIILDAPYADFASKLKTMEGPSTTNRLIIESAGPRMESPESKSGLMAHALLDALNSLGTQSNNGLITAKALEHHLIDEYQKEQLGINTYFNGIDFTVMRTLDVKNTSDEKPPVVEISKLSLVKPTRGAKVKNTGSNLASIVGIALDVSGIKEVEVDGKKAELSKNGKFQLVNFEPSNEYSLIIRTTDNNGNIAIDTANFSDESLGSNNAMASGSGKNYALLFATDTYNGAYWDNLSNPIRDAKSIGQILEKQYGFEVEIVTNPTLTQFQHKIYEYMRRDFKLQDQLFVFVAGHGMYDETIGGQIVCTDSKHPTKELHTYLPYWFLTSNLNSMQKCNNVFLSLDVCFGGGFFDRQEVRHYMGSKSYVNRSQFIHDKKASKTRLFLTSGSKEYVPDGRPGAHSPFAQMFIEALESKGGAKNYLTLADITNYMGRLQTKPRYGRFGENGLDGDFIFEAIQGPIDIPLATRKR